jgi:hypothetical protein
MIKYTYFEEATPDEIWSLVVIAEHNPANTYNWDWLLQWANGKHGSIDKEPATAAKVIAYYTDTNKWYHGR